MEKDARLVAIVDDDPAICRSLARLMRALGYEARVFDLAIALLHGIGTTPPTHILLDLHMPGPGGPPLVSHLRTRWPRVRILVMSGFETPGTAQACVAAGAMLFARKPLRLHEIQSFLDPVDTPGT